MKQIIPIILISSIFVFFIYQIFNTKETIITSIGDSYNYGDIGNGMLGYSYLDDLSNKNIKINQIKYSKTYLSINNHKYDNIIHKSSYIIIFIGLEELNNTKTINNEIITTFLNEYTTLINNIYKLNHHIIIINFPNIKNDKAYTIINNYLNGLAKDYKLELINIDSSNNYHQEIYERLIEYLQLT